LGIVILVLVVGGGLMFVRMQRTQQTIVQETLAAQMEAERQVAEMARAAIHAREQLKAAHFPNQRDAIQTGDAVLTYLANPADQRDPSEYVGRDVVLYGIGPGLRAGELDMIVSDTIHVRVQIDKSKLALPELPGWSAFVLGKIVAIDRPTNTITVKVQPENWKIEPPK
jgi:hypothetical protein